MNNKKLIFFYILIIVFNFSVIKIYADSDYENLLISGKSFYNEGKYHQAINSLQSASILLEGFDSKYEAYLYLGFSYYMINNLKYSEAFRNAIKINPIKKLDPKIISPKIIKIYDEIRNEVAGKEGRINLISFSAKQYFESIPEKKTTISFEIKDFLLETKDESKNKKITANYRTQFVNLEYGITKIFFLYIGAGAVEIGLPEKYGEPSFAYEAGVKIDILYLKKLDIDLRAEYLNFNDESDSLNRKIKWKELRTGTAINFHNFSNFTPYIGFYKIIIDSSLDYSQAENQQNELVINLKNKDSSNEFFAGAKINLEPIFLLAEIYYMKDMGNFKIGIGKAF